MSSRTKMLALPHLGRQKTYLALELLPKVGIVEQEQEHLQNAGAVSKKTCGILILIEPFSCKFNKMYIHLQSKTR